MPAQADLNRPWLNAALGAEYLPSITDVHQRLSREGARVADLGCGVGWAGIAIAHAYPRVAVYGYDTDSYALELARKHAAGQGVADRVTFTLHDVTEPVVEDRYDLAVIVETAHDLARPVAFLDAVRRMLASVRARRAALGSHRHPRPPRDHAPLRHRGRLRPRARPRRDRPRRLLPLLPPGPGSGVAGQRFPRSPASRGDAGPR